jgi:hypothetical protein
MDSSVGCGLRADDFLGLSLRSLQLRRAVGSVLERTCTAAPSPGKMNGASFYAECDIAIQSNDSDTFTQTTARL